MNLENACISSTDFVRWAKAEGFLQERLWATANAGKVGLPGAAVLLAPDGLLRDLFPGGAATLEHALMLMARCAHATVVSPLVVRMASRIDRTRTLCQFKIECEGQVLYETQPLRPSEPLVRWILENR